MEGKTDARNHVDFDRRALGDSFLDCFEGSLPTGVQIDDVAHDDVQAGIGVSDGLVIAQLVAKTGFDLIERGRAEDEPCLWRGTDGHNFSLWDCRSEWLNNYNIKIILKQNLRLCRAGLTEEYVRPARALLEKEDTGLFAQ